MEKNETTPNRLDSESQVTYETFRIINRVINIFGGIITVFLLLIFISIVFYLFLPLMTNSFEHETYLKIDQIFQKIDPIMNKIWDFIKPLIQFVIIVFIIKWVVFSNSKTSDKLQNLIKDIPSFIALVVIATLCLIPIIGYTIPAPIGNIALVVVGFYFGNKYNTHENNTGKDTEQ